MGISRIYIKAGPVIEASVPTKHMLQIFHNFLHLFSDLSYLGSRFLEIIPSTGETCPAQGITAKWYV